MMSPVGIQHIAAAAVLAGAIVFFGAAYSLLYAMAMLRQATRYLLFAYVGYLGLLVATMGLCVALQLTGWWLGLVVALLAGYFVAPRFIWRLSVVVHDAEEPASPAITRVGRE